jgi:hypothetical protein
LRTFTRVCFAGALVLVAAALLTLDRALSGTALVAGVIAPAVSAAFTIRAARPGRRGGLAEGLTQLALLLGALALLPR